MDMKMPVMSGFEAVKRIKTDVELQGIPIIAFTAHALKEEEEQIMALGCSGFLRKPVSRIQLVMELTKHLPYTIRESSGSMPPVSASTEFEFLSTQDRFSPIPAENVEPLIEALENNFMKKCLDIQKSLIIKDAKNFALQIKELGKSSGAEMLINWADRVLTDIQLVNINKVASAIAIFPIIIEYIKSNQGDKNE
jgi:CheY-like chemotaxis protein